MIEAVGGSFQKAVEVSDSPTIKVEEARPGLRSTFLETIDSYVVGEHGVFDTTMISTGGCGRSKICLSASLMAVGAEVDINGLSLAGGLQKVDMRTNIHHVCQGTLSRQGQRNVVGGKGNAAFKGRMRVEEMAQQANSNQLARTLLLNDRCKITNCPSLEIIADDVKCTHGATISDLSEEELFYLRSRGLDREIGRNILMYAFVDEMGAKVSERSERALRKTSILAMKHNGYILLIS